MSFKSFSLYKISYIFTLILFVVQLTHADAQQQKPFKIGIILPLTGALAEYGVAAKNGFEMAKQENSEVFKNIELIYDDSQYDGKKTLTSFQKFKVTENVSLLYVWGYGPSQALIPVAEAQKFPVIAVSAERSAFLQKEFVLRFGYHIQMIADALMDQLRSQKIKKVAVVKTELAYMNGLVDAMKKIAKEGEIVEVIDNYSANDFDFATSILKLRSKNFDALGVFLLPDQVNQFYKQSKLLNYKFKGFSTDFLDSMNQVKSAQGDLTGTIFAGPFVDHSFVSRYIKLYNNDIQAAWAANAYDFAVLTAKLFGEKNSRLSSEQIIQTYKNSSQVQNEETATKHKYVESPEGSGFDPKVVVRRIEADRIVNVD